MKTLNLLILAMGLNLFVATAHAEICSDSEGNDVKATLQKSSNGDYKIGGLAKINKEKFKIVDVSSDGGGSVNVNLKSLNTGLVINVTCGDDVRE